MSQTTIAETLARPIRAGIFSNVEKAEEAIDRLLAAGFVKDQITVVTSDEGMRRHFNNVKLQEPAGAHTEEAVVIGSSFGAALGAIGIGAVGVALGGVPLLVVAGTYGLVAGGVVGGFVGAMLTRGIENEVANFYDQEVADGNLLVAVEVDELDAKLSLWDAERILAEAGAKPLPLPEG
jgi:outer membrane lipoprotein SlyB